MLFKKKNLYFLPLGSLIDEDKYVWISLQETDHRAKEENLF